MAPPRGGPTAAAQGRRRGDNLLQTIHMLRLLRGGRWQVDELAAEVGVTRRTAYRVLSALERAGLSLERSSERPKVYYSVTRESVEALFAPQRKR